VNRLNLPFMPFDGYFRPETSRIDYLRRYMENTSSGVDVPVAIVVETVQCEGGVNVPNAVAEGLESLCREH
jgi:diaminobutyrate-2-oxoglutarate transaminase